MGDQEAGLEWWNFAFLFTITAEAGSAKSVRSFPVMAVC